MKNLLKQIPTNINYYNYYNNSNYNNNLTTDNDITTDTHRWSSSDQNDTSELPLASPFEEPKEKNIVSHSEGLRKLPQAWKAIKLDLYCNGTLKGGLPNFKLKCLATPKASSKIELVCLLNTPWESGRMKYNVNADAWDNDYHWNQVKHHYHTIKNLYDDVRCGKLAKTYKGAPTPIAVFLSTDNNNYYTDLVIKGEVFTYILDGELSEAQTQANQIATVKIGHASKKMLSWEDLGL